MLFSNVKNYMYCLILSEKISYVPIIIQKIQLYELLKKRISFIPGYIYRLNIKPIDIKTIDSIYLIV